MKRHRCPDCNGICGKWRAVYNDGRKSEDFWRCRDCKKEHPVAKRIRKPAQMRCNNCGGRMFRSDVRYHVTVCRGPTGNEAGCGMVHDWEHVDARR